EDNNVSKISLVRIRGRSVELNQVNAVDVKQRVLNRDLFVDDIQHLHSKSGVSRNGLGVDLADVKLCGIYQSEEASAEGDGELDLFAVDGYGLVLFVNECRNVGQSYA